jgi:predicted transcriptional regulator
MKMKGAHHGGKNQQRSKPMSARWFRFYDEVIDDPKVQSLSGDDFKMWINMLCIASKNEGIFPSFDQIAFHLRTDERGVERYTERLLNAGLIDRRNGGVNGYHYAPHGWDKRQFKSDTSTERVKRFRQRVSETPPETETETDINNPPLPIDQKAKKTLLDDLKNQQSDLPKSKPEQPPSNADLELKLFDIVHAAGMSSMPKDGHYLALWLKKGADFDCHIMPVIRRASDRILRQTGRAPFTLKIFHDEIAQAVAKDRAGEYARACSDQQITSMNERFYAQKRETDAYIANALAQEAALTDQETNAAETIQ